MFEYRRYNFAIEIFPGFMACEIIEPNQTNESSTQKSSLIPANCDLRNLREDNGVEMIADNTFS